MAMGETMNQSPPAKPWQITSIKDHGTGEWYRYSIEGVNHYYEPARTFSWSVPDLNDPRFDTSLVTT